MCGIFGFRLRRPLTAADLDLGRRATAMIAYRGPDNGDEWFDEAAGIYFGHRRLSIIDVTEASDQPMHLDQRVIIYNGELYNFVELRDELTAAGHHFRTSGDTEVLLRAWLEWKQDALLRFDGMFAFALYEAGRLTLATDAFGEKPIYLAETPDGIYFCSEPAPLIELLGLSFSPTAEETAAFLSLGFLPAPATGFPGLRAVGPASHIAIGPDLRISERKWWTAPVSHVGKGPVSPLNEAELDEIQESLIASMRCRVRADVPLGLFLSGGVDSATIAAIAARDLSLPLQTFTVAFPDGVDETGAAANIARHFGLPHRVIDSQSDDAMQAADADLTSLFGIPNDNATAFSVRQMSALARSHLGLKVALSGTGGDEAFYGYSKYSFLDDRAALYRLSPLVDLLKPLESLLRFIPAWRQAASLLPGSPARQFLSLKNNGLGGLLTALPGFAATDALLPQAESGLAYAVRDFDMATTLPGSYIPAVERGSMRSSLEVRTPYLNRALIDLLARHDQRRLLRFGQKSVLRRILARYMPENLLTPGKRGFVYPIKRWLVKGPAAAPAVPHIPASVADTIWSQRTDSRFHWLATRLAVLAHLHDIHPSERI